MFLTLSIFTSSEFSVPASFPALGLLFFVLLFADLVGSWNDPQKEAENKHLCHTWPTETTSHHIWLEMQVCIQVKSRAGHAAEMVWQVETAKYILNQAMMTCTKHWLLSENERWFQFTFSAASHTHTLSDKLVHLYIERLYNDAHGQKHWLMQRLRHVRVSSLCRNLSTHTPLFTY